MKTDHSINSHGQTLIKTIYGPIHNMSSEKHLRIKNIVVRVVIQKHNNITTNNNNYYTHNNELYYVIYLMFLLLTHICGTSYFLSFYFKCLQKLKILYSLYTSTNLSQQ